MKKPDKNEWKNEWKNVTKNEWKKNSIIYLISKTPYMEIEYKIRASFWL